MKTKLFTFIAICTAVAMFSQTTVPEGPIEGTWTLSGSPYLIEGTTTIENGKTLTIEPGVLVEWQGSYTMWVEGRILAQGTETDTIVFTAADTAAGFRSIRFIDTPNTNDTSQFKFCSFKYGRVYGMAPDNYGGAIGVINYNKIVIEHCLFYRNRALAVSDEQPAGGAIALSSSSIVIKNNKFLMNESLGGGGIFCYFGSIPEIRDNEFEKNIAYYLGAEWGQGYGGAVLCYLNAYPEISRNVFKNNTAQGGGGALAMVDQCDPVVDHNLFYDNYAEWWGGAVEIQFNCSPEIVNNTIVNNSSSTGKGGGIDIQLGGDPVIKNTILWGNSAFLGDQVYIADGECAPDISYCDLEGGLSAIGNHQFVGTYDENIDDNPIFEDLEADIYYILKESPCLDLGDPDMLDPDQTICDIGAYYLNQDPTDALDPTDHTMTSFVANWEEAEGALGYLLDVSTDPEFETYLEGYQNLDVGNVTSYLVDNLEPGTPCFYRIRANYYFGRGGYSNVIGLTVATPEFEQTPLCFKVMPNPIANSAVIEFAVSDRVPVKIKLYNISGKKVLTLFDAQLLQGVHQYPWDASALPDGIYLISLTEGQQHITRKIIKQ